MPTTCIIEEKKILPCAEEETPAILPIHPVSDVVMTSGLGPGLRGWGARHEEEEQGASLWAAADSLHRQGVGGTR